MNAAYTDRDLERFAAKVKLPTDLDECWIWNGAKHGQGRGYGKFRLGKVMSAHKAAYLLFVGEVAEGLVLGHQCNNESCCNPYHLHAESQSQNMTYCVRSGRHGSQNR